MTPLRIPKKINQLTKIIEQLSIIDNSDKRECTQESIDNQLFEVRLQHKRKYNTRNQESKQHCERSLTVNDQLNSVRKLHNQRYQVNKISQNTNTKNSSLKSRLERIANYNNTTNDTTDDTTETSNYSYIDEEHDLNDKIAVKNMPVTCILGDSIIKEVKGWKLSDKIDKKEKVIVKSFSGATIKCMRDHIKPSISQKPDHVIIHAGTNDLPSNKSEEEIASSIIDLAQIVKHSTVAISALVFRDDKWCQKAKNVNKVLLRMCQLRNIAFLSHENINKAHLNRSKLHLNKSGTKLLTKNLALFISKK